MTIKKLQDLQTYDEKKMTKQVVIEEEKSRHQVLAGTSASKPA